MRAERSGAIETRDQEKFVLKLRAKVTNPRSKVPNFRAKSSRDEEGAGDWFKRLTGFRETSYHETRAKLEVKGDRLRSLVNGQTYGIGQLELVSLYTLRQRVKSGGSLAGRLKVGVVTGDVRQMHQATENAGAFPGRITIQPTGDDFALRNTRGWCYTLSGRPDAGAGLRHRCRDS